jgi:hypothetical protein
MSLIHRLAGRSFSDATLPLLYPDKMANPGTKFIFDFLNGYNIQGLTMPVGANPFAAGTHFKNAIFPVGPDGVISGATIQYSGGGLLMAADASIVDLGATYDMSASNPHFLAIAWVKRPDNLVVSAAQAICGLTKTNANDCQFGFSFSNASSQFNAIAGGTTQPFSPAQVNGTIYQLAVEWSPGVLSTYKNGVLAVANTVSQNALVALPNNTKIGSMAGFSAGRAVLYRFLLENLTVSGKTAADQVAADYAANNGRFA